MAEKEQKPESGMKVFLAGTDGLEFTLPNGKKVTAKVLPMPVAAKLMQLWEQHLDGLKALRINAAKPLADQAVDPRTPEQRNAKYVLFEEFEKATGLAGQLGLTWDEMWTVMGCFFSTRESPSSPVLSEKPSN